VKTIVTLVAWRVAAGVAVSSHRRSTHPESLSAWPGHSLRQGQGRVSSHPESLSASDRSGPLLPPSFLLLGLCLVKRVSCHPEGRSASDGSGLVSSLMPGYVNTSLPRYVNTRLTNAAKAVVGRCEVGLTGRRTRAAALIRPTGGMRRYNMGMVAIESTDAELGRAIVGFFAVQAPVAACPKPIVGPSISARSALDTHLGCDDGVPAKTTGAKAVNYSILLLDTRDSLLPKAVDQGSLIVVVGKRTSREQDSRSEHFEM